MTIHSVEDVELLPDCETKQGTDHSSTHPFFLQVELQDVQCCPDQQQQATFAAMLKEFEQLDIGGIRTDDLIAKYPADQGNALETLFKASLAADAFFVRTGWPVSACLVSDTTAIVD